jgi:hypothetical protein
MNSKWLVQLVLLLTTVIVSTKVFVAATAVAVIDSFLRMTELLFLKITKVLIVEIQTAE